MVVPILAIDQGTTGTTCLVVDVSSARSGGKICILGRGYAEIPQHFPQPGWVEHDLDEIWDATLKAIAAARKSAGPNGDKLAAIGITNQRETTGIWDLFGKPLHRAIVWQDRRTAKVCERLRSAGHSALFKERTGLVLDPYFSGTKLAWLLDELPDLRQRARRGEICFGTIDTWLLWKLTAGKVFATDATNASRTLLFDIHKGSWDDELCDLVGEIPRSMLPEVKSSAEVYGTTSGVDVLPDGIPIAGIAGDQQSALFGQACFKPGAAKCTYGTGAFVLLNTGAKACVSQGGLLTTVAWNLAGKTTYALEGSAFVAGAVVQWLRDGLGMFKSSAEIEALAAQVSDSGGVVFVPALTGLGAPYWRPEARGLISGISRGTTNAHIARAALEGVAFQIYDLLTEAQKHTALTFLRVDGGASSNNLLMQFQADILGIEIHRPKVLETTALGCALLAALGGEHFANLDQITASWDLDRCFYAQMPTTEAAALLDRWHQNVAKA